MHRRIRNIIGVTAAGRFSLTLVTTDSTPFCSNLLSLINLIWFDYGALIMAEAEVVPDAPHQPRGFDFPKREFEKKSVVKRAFQAKWFDRWSWLHYSEARDVVFCFTCFRAHAEGKLVWSANADGAFIDIGFSN